MHAVIPSREGVLEQLFVFAMYRRTAFLAQLPRMRVPRPRKVHALLRVLPCCHQKGTRCF
jgi:hypothetical protein